MHGWREILILSVVFLVASGTGGPVLHAQEKEPVDLGELDLSLSLADVGPVALAGDEPAEPSAETGTAPATKGPPLPLHTIEGTGGAPITQMAYLVNPGPEGTTIGLPSFSYTFLKLGEKSLHSYALSQTFFRRIEFSYAANRVDLGDFDDDVRTATGLETGRDDIYLHHLNLRGLLVEEEGCIPAVTGGVHFKINQGIKSIDHRLNGTLREASDTRYAFFRSLIVNPPRGTIATGGIGKIQSIGIGSKMFPDLAFGRPVITSLGLRWTQAAQIGWLGFGNDWATNIEANVACLVTDWLAVVYEYRQKESPYSRLQNLVDREEDWHAIDVVWIINEHTTLAGVWADLGNMANGVEDCTWGLQFKYEF